MNTREKRLDKLESIIKLQDKGGIVLYDEHGKRVEAVIQKMPTVEVEGMAKLADGPEMPIIFEKNWNCLSEILLRGADGVIILSNESGNSDMPSLEGRLFMRYSECKITVIDCTGCDNVE